MVHKFCLALYFSLIFISNVNVNSLKYPRNNRAISESVSHEHASCKAPEHKSELRKSMKRFMCQPMDTVVHFYSKDQNVMMIPDKVVVKRCYETGCYGRNSCVANNTREVPVAVRFINTIPQKNQKSCGWVNVIEHVQCTCGCNINRDECEQSGKIFNGHDCTCKCPNENKRKSECNRQIGMEWDEDECACKCTTQIMDCTTGTEWVPKYCQCLKVMM